MKAWMTVVVVPFLMKPITFKDADHIDAELTWKKWTGFTESLSELYAKANWEVKPPSVERYEVEVRDAAPRPAPDPALLEALRATLRSER